MKVGVTRQHLKEAVVVGPEAREEAGEEVRVLDPVVDKVEG